MHAVVLKVEQSSGFEFNFINMLMCITFSMFEEYSTYLYLVIKFYDNGYFMT